MDTKQILNTAITAFILAIVLPVIFGVLEAANKRRSRRVGGISILKYPVAAKALGILGIAMSAVMIIGALHAPAGRRTLAITIYGLMALLFLVLPLEFYSRRIEFDNQKIVIRCLWHSERRIPWADVISFIHQPHRKVWVLETKTYGKITISSFLEGLHDLQMAAVKYGKAA